MLKHTATTSISGITYSSLLDSNEGQNLTAPLKYVAAYLYNPGSSRCTITATGDDSTFTLARLDLDINLFESSGLTSVPLTMTFNPGEPNMTIKQACTGGVAVQILSSPRWREYYGLNHGQEFKSPNFVAKKWTINGTGDIYASKKYGTALIGSETTEIDLKHTPQ